MSQLELRRFTRSDWDAFAGCDTLPDGSQPWIGSLDEYVVIVCGETSMPGKVLLVVHDERDPDAPREFFQEYADEISALSAAKNLEHVSIPAVLAYEFIRVL